MLVASFTGSSECKVSLKATSVGLQCQTDLQSEKSLAVYAGKVPSIYTALSLYLKAIIKVVSIQNYCFAFSTMTPQTDNANILPSQKNTHHCFELKFTVKVLG